VGALRPGPGLDATLAYDAADRLVARPTPTPQPGPRPSALPRPSPDVHLPSAHEVLESSVGPAAIAIAGVAAVGEARAEHLLRQGLAEALRLRQLAATPDPRLLLRLPIVREVRSTGLRLQADVRELATRVGAGSLQLLYRISATAGGVLTASHAASGQLHEDAHRRDLSVDARLARAAFRGIVTSASSAVLGVAAGVACAPATLTVAGAVLTAGCAIGGAAAGEAAGSAFSGAILRWSDPRFGL
jgi:hypothetical protein